MLNYLIVVGKGKTRKTLSFYRRRYVAVNVLNSLILDYGIHDARLVVSKVRPDENLYARYIAEIVREQLPTVSNQ